MHYVYILYSASADKFYIGQTEDVAQRMIYHNHPIEGRKFTVRGIPWELKISVCLPSKRDAMELERFIKRMKSRKFLQRFIDDESLRMEIFLKTAPDC